MNFRLQPILPKFCILLHCQASQTEVSKRNSTKLCQTVDSKFSRKKPEGQKTFTFVKGFWRLRDLKANVFRMKHEIDNRVRALESTRGPLHCRKISWTLVHKRLKTGPELLRILSILFRFQSIALIAHAVSGINVAPTANLNETTLDLSAAQIRSPKEILS